MRKRGKMRPMLETTPAKFDTFIPHSHYFRLYVRLGGKADEAYALCDCGCELAHEQIEMIVNRRQLEAQEA